MTAQKIRPYARILQLLGDELIGNARLAVFELVKNAYDADANEVFVKFEDFPIIPDPDNKNDKRKIIVIDNGEGMSEKIIKDVWLKPGSDYRKKQKQKGTRSKKYNRLPLGEKGVGRFAVHKLGDKISLNTKSQNDKEYSIEIDWDKLNKSEHLDEVEIDLKEADPNIFSKTKSGTKITISKLKSEWSRGDVRRLYRNLASINSPFNTPEDFKIKFEMQGHESWYSDLLKGEDIFKLALWEYSFKVEEAVLTWEYKFKPYAKMKIKGRNKSGEQPLFTKDCDTATIKKAQSGIGPVKGKFYIFDLSADTTNLMQQPASLKDYLKENSGVRVFRDGVRVHNYGEKADDWLGLDARRIQNPSSKISNPLTLGFIDLELQNSQELKEKTNREGFVENDALKMLREIVLGTIEHLETLRNEDKERLRESIEKTTTLSIANIDNEFSMLREGVSKAPNGQTLLKHINQIEKNFRDMREVTINSGIRGLNLSLIFHEVEKGVHGLYQALKAGQEHEKIIEKSGELVQLLDGFGSLLKTDPKKKYSMKKILHDVMFFAEKRFALHDIVYSCPILTDEQKDFEVEVSLPLFIGAISNIIDNAIYWMGIRWGDSKGKAIYIGRSDDFESGPSLIIADNGTGFDILPENRCKPFMSNKQGGMGLGLYYANMVMEMYGGELAFPEKGDLDISDKYDGATLALVFRE